MGHWAQNQASTMAIPVSWPAPCRKWVRWTEEKKHRNGAVDQGQGQGFFICHIIVIQGIIRSEM